MEQKLSFLGGLKYYFTAKTYFAIFLLLNIFSSLFHLYYSNEPISKGEIYSEGNTIVYNSAVTENVNVISPNNCVSNAIHLEGGVLLYGRLNNQQRYISTNAQSKKNEKKVTHNHKSEKKEFNSKKSNAHINALANTSDILLGLCKSNSIAVNVSNFYPKFGFKDNLALKIILLNTLENKLSNKLFPEEKESSFFKRHFGRPPPFLV